MLSAIVILLYIFMQGKPVQSLSLTIVQNNRLICLKILMPNASRYRKALPQAKCLVFLFFFTKLFKELANLFSLF